MVTGFGLSFLPNKFFCTGAKDAPHPLWDTEAEISVSRTPLKMDLNWDDMPKGYFFQTPRELLPS